MAQRPLRLSFTILDVFTNTPYSGNPLAVVHVPRASHDRITQEQKQCIAKEFNLSETVFLHEGRFDREKGEECDIDIFTPDEELPFAGHPTIGAASWVLGLDPAYEGRNGPEKGILSMKAGLVPIAVSWGTDRDMAVTAEVPFNTHRHRGNLAFALLLKAQGGRPSVSGLQLNPEIQSKELASSLFSIVKGMTFLLVELEDLDMLGGVEMSGTAPDFFCDGVMDEGWREGFVGRYYYVLLSNSSPDVVQIRARMVEAKMEDPATGSAACALSCYLATTKFKKSTKFKIVQGVEMGRRSCIGVEVDVGDEGEVKCVRLSGSAVEVMRGKVRV